MAPSESVLKFDLVVTNGATEAAYMRLDKGGASGIIQRIRVYSGSNLIEDIDNYGCLVSNLSALQKSSVSSGKDNILCGFSAEYFTDTTTNETMPVVAGERLIDDGQVTPFSAIIAGGLTLKRTYTISLLSILGTLSDKYLPLFAMTATSLRLEIQLVSSANKFICSPHATGTFAISNIEFIASMMELGDQAMQTIAGNLGNEPLQYAIPQWKNYAHNFPIVNATATQVTVPVAAKFNSVKSLITFFRTNSDGAATFFPHGSNRFGLDEYSVRLGSKVLPSKSPRTVPEFFVELLKAIGSVSDINHECMVNLANYSQNVPGANGEIATAIAETSSSPSFAIGMDLESYSNSDRSSVYTGYNTTTEDIFLQLRFNGTANVQNIRSDTYCLYDAVLICENGTASVRF